MTSDNENNPHKRIADMIDAGDDRFEPAGDSHFAPHPLDSGFPNFDGASDEDVEMADDQRPADADNLSRETLILCAREPQNDTGNAKRLLYWFGDDIVNVRDMGWLYWTGTHWESDGGDEVVMSRAQTVASRIALEADVMVATPNEQRAIDNAGASRNAMAAIEKEKPVKAKLDQRWQMLSRVVGAGKAAEAALKSRQTARRKYSVSSGNKGKVINMFESAVPHRIMTIDARDADKLAFNVLNGTLHFVYDEVPDPDSGDHEFMKTLKRWRVELRPHNRADYITKVAPVQYDPNAICQFFKTSIERFQPIREVRKFLQRYHGYALTGLTGEQCLVFNYGGGSNWKSTFIDLVCRVMGPYAQTLPFESLSGDVQKSGSQASPEFARLPGCRLLRAGEPDQGVQFRDGLIKSLTGGEPMLTRANFGDFFEFRPDFKIVLSGNHKPRIAGVDHGIWRRMNLVPWPVKIEAHEKRPMPEVMAELMPEAPGILNWLVDGALAYLNGGLKPPREVIEATAAYQEEMDPVGAFVGMCVKTVPAAVGDAAPAFVPARALYDAFVAWCYVNERQAWKEKSFSIAMTEKGFKKEKHRTGIRYLNVMLQDVPARPSRREEPPHPSDDDAMPA